MFKKSKRLSLLLVLTILCQLLSTVPIYADKLYGDFDGDNLVTAIDFARLRQYLLQSDNLSVTDSNKNYDLYADGKINALDFAILRKYLLGMINDLPYIPGANPTPTAATATPQGDWVPFVPKPEDVGLTLVIDCSAGSRDKEQKYIDVNITFYDGGYRIADEGKLETISEGSFTTSGVQIEKYVGPNGTTLALMNKQIRYQLDTTLLTDKNHFEFKVGDTVVKELSFTQSSIIPPTPVPYGAEVNKNFVNANTQFAANLLKKINEEDSDKNVFFSPYSLSMALSMVYQGANATTKEAMASALNYTGMSTEEINQSYIDQLSYFKKLNPEVELNIANSIWVNDKFEVNKNFLAKNEEVFNSQVSYLDFDKSDAVDIMNKWISDSTKGKIDKMLSPPIPSDIIMYLMNAIYFKGNWTDKFDIRQTTDSTFTNIKGEQKTVPMMNKTDKYKYAQTSEYRAIELPYGSGSVSMYCILPETGNVNDFIATFDNSKWSEIKSKLAMAGSIHLSIPRFKIEYKPQKLNDKLKELGMEEAFSRGADFTGIADDVWISSVEHKAVIDVNETGTEAAAVTVIGMGTTSMPNSFIANKPFMFVIADNATGTVLFMGKVADVE
jgi:serine protease inhibitor